jgi:Uma2 family endonuclease
MQHITETNKTVSLQEYIKLDETGTVRHEYYDGKLIPMPGETLLHNQLCINLLIVLKANLKSSFKLYIESVKVKIEGEDKYVYPDITVIKNQLLKELPHKDYIIYEPLLIAEVLSDSTRKYDLTDKFILYQKISSLQYYLAIEPEKKVVFFFEKNEEGEWMAKTYTELTESIALPLFETQITLENIYA